MSGRGPWHRSLRWRLTLSFAGLLAVLLVVAAGIEYSLLRQAVISTRAQAMRTAYADARTLLARQERSRLAAGKPLVPVRSLARGLAQAMAADHLTAVVIGPDLRVLASAAPGTTGAAPVSPAPALPDPGHQFLLAAAQFDTVSGPDLLGSGSQRDLVMVFPLSTPKRGDLGAVEVAEAATSVDQELGQARLVLGLGSLAVLLAAIGVGLWITGRSLRRLHRLTEAAQQLGTGDLTARSGLSPQGDEVGMLAGVFDRMAESVERTVRVREEANSRMRQFVADASHELRTPLTAIKGYLEVLQRGAAQDPQVLGRALGVMSTQAERMRRLVADLLALARADSERRPEPRPVDLATFLTEFLDEHPRAQMAPASGPLVALADPDSLLTVCTNLQANAERHGGGASIVWEAGADGHRVFLSCSDQGPGIAPEDLPHVFDRFYRSGGSRSRDEGGSGLGLAIVKALVEAQGGEVRAESEAGRGARVTVWLPAASTLGWTAPASPPASRD